ncbi:33270_t:CDS:2 [Gigaspora margarita]|uniref:33270_t:CDS:1 n=1 Tax=Gigaspora margarita TaxID=4874 RepID=A0ABM8W749_GIGMA|nr:33270_t:CDS:2 [Gigaspora margarita]
MNPHSSEIKEFWRERNLRIVLKEKTVKSTEKIIDQINTVNNEDGCSNKHKYGMEKNETEQPQTPEDKEEPSNTVLREQKKETDSLKSDYEEFEDKNESTANNIFVEFDSRESTPSKQAYNQYSMHVICAFGSTLHLVKETIDKQLYEEIEKIIKMRNKSFLNSSIVKKLGTAVEDYEITEDARNSYPDIKYEWIEKDVRSIKGANMDLLILRLSDTTEILDIEVSGSPFNSSKKYTV